eukprot:548825-Amphidinium_carterae.1
MTRHGMLTQHYQAQCSQALLFVVRKIISYSLGPFLMLFGGRENNSPGKAPWNTGASEGQPHQEPCPF